MAKPHLTAHIVQKHYSYDAETGIFTRRNDCPNKRFKAGDRSGGFAAYGYRTICIGGIRYFEHVAAWAYIHGGSPLLHIDHINGNRCDNRIDNLREVTQKQNNENRGIDARNTSGFRGVSWSKAAKKFEAYIKHNGKRRHLGLFSSALDAAATAKEARDSTFTHHRL